MTTSELPSVVLAVSSTASCSGSGPGTRNTVPQQGTPPARLVSCAKPAEVLTSTTTIELGSCDGTYGIYPEGGIIVTAGEAIRVKPRLAGTTLPPMHSSDETVLHLLPGDGKAGIEFQAEHAGTVDVLAQTSDCHSANRKPTNPCIVTHVIVGNP